ncbi:MAG: D-aminoacyl-tRNA deacylase [Spirochaetales bacterium]
MRAVVQRVSEAAVHVGERCTGRIGVGLLVLVGVGNSDSKADVSYLAAKLVGLRVFEDEQGRMNRSVSEAGGSILCVSQFTLHGDARKGRRPSYNGAASPDLAQPLFDALCTEIRELGVPVETGEFGAMMTVSMTGNGPVTVLVDSKKQF